MGRRFRPALDYSIYHRHRQEVPASEVRHLSEITSGSINLSAFQHCHGFPADRRPVAAANAPAFTPPPRGLLATPSLVDPSSLLISNADLASIPCSLPASNQMFRRLHTEPLSSAPLVAPISLIVTKDDFGLNLVSQEEELNNTEFLQVYQGAKVAG